MTTHADNIKRLADKYNAVGAARHRTTTIDDIVRGELHHAIDALQAECDGLKDYARAAESLYEKAIAERDAKATEIARIRKASGEKSLMIELQAREGHEKDADIARLREALENITQHSVCCDARHEAAKALEQTK